MSVGSACSLGSQFAILAIEPEFCYTGWLCCLLVSTLYLPLACVLAINDSSEDLFLNACILFIAIMQLCWVRYKLQRQFLETFFFNLEFFILSALNSRVLLWSISYIKSTWGSKHYWIVYSCSLIMTSSLFILSLLLCYSFHFQKNRMT